MSLFAILFLFAIACCGFAWFVMVVWPVLFAANYDVMLENWNKTSPKHHLIGVVVTVVTVLFLIGLVLSGTVLSALEIFALLPFIFTTLSFFIIYTRSRYKK